MPSETVTVAVGSGRFTRWSAIDIVYSADAASRSATLVAADVRMVGELTANVALGDPASVAAGSTLLMTGFIETLAPEVDGEAHRLTITIASLASHAAEASADHPTGEVRRRRLSTMLNEIDPTGTRWVGRDDQVEALVRIRPGESPFEVAERVARRQGVLLISRPDGGVDLAKGVQGHHAGLILEGDVHRGFTRGGATLTLRGQPSEVSVRGQSHERADGRSLKIDHKVKLPGARHHRPLVIYHEGEANTGAVRTRAAWEALRRKGAGTTATLTLPRWRDEGGLIWTPAYDIPVRAPRLRIDQRLAVRSVHLHQGAEDGTFAVLQLVDPRGLGGTDPGGASGKEWGGSGEWTE